LNEDPKSNPEPDQRRLFTPPTPGQARILWMSTTAVAIAIVLALIGVVVWGFGMALQKLSPVLLPLAIAGILAYLIDPVVDFFGRRGIPRTRAIFLVFTLVLLAVGLVSSLVIPKLLLEARDLADQVPDFGEQISGAPAPRTTSTNAVMATQATPSAPPPTNSVASTSSTNTPKSLFTVPKAWMEKTEAWLDSSPWGMRLRKVWDTELKVTVEGWAKKTVPVVSNWVLQQVKKVASWFGLIVGLALVPVYLFYFLQEKKAISENWTDYLPILESKTKDELVFILRAINDYLILFFRGQILVAICIGVLLTIGFALMGLKYGLLLGIAAGALSIVPYLGIVLSVIPAVALAAVQFGDWLHPLLVIGVFSLVQFLEGFFISPKIMGDRVGLHPLTIIIAVMVGTTLMGGIIGGILAIPLTAALRVLMFRYVWKRRAAPQPAIAA
jgi:predicted PurR-regulated permease PerM